MPNLDLEVLNIIEVISIRILVHILDNDIVDSLQSVYRAGHSCEMDLLRVYNDMFTTLSKTYLADMSDWRIALRLIWS